MATLLGANQATNKSVGPSTGGNFMAAGANMVASASGTAEQISFYIWYGTEPTKAAVYSADGSTKLGETNASTGGAGLKTLPFISTFSIVSGTTYRIALIRQEANEACQFRTNNDGTDSVGQAELASASPPATFSFSLTGNNLGVMGALIEGTASGGGGSGLGARRISLLGVG